MERVAPLPLPLHARGREAAPALAGVRGPRISVVLSSHVGRNLFCTPALALIRRRWPDARVDVVVGSSRGAAVLEGNPHVHGVHVARTRIGVRRRTRSADLILGLAGQPDATLGSRAGDAAVLWIPRLPGIAHRADEILDFVSAVLGCTPSERERRYVLCPRPADRRHAEGLVPRRDQTRVVGLHLGSGRTHAHGWKFWYGRRDADPRLWGVANYIELAHRLTSREAATRFVLTGTRSESYLSRAFSSAVPGTVDLTGRTTVLELAAVMAQLDAFVSGDTGPMHVAAATDTPLVALFGTTDPGQTGPYPERRYQPVIKAQSLAEITPSSIANVVERVLLQAVVDRVRELPGDRPCRTNPRLGVDAGRS